MKSCSGYQETLWMDIHGELESEFQSDWTQHLETCTDCSHERENLHRFIQKVQDAVPSPVLSSEEKRSMSRFIMQELQKDQESGWRKWLQFSSGKRVPALLTACLVLIIFGWFGIQEQKAGPVKTASNLNLDEQLIIKDFDVINNLELLEEMENLEKLVKVVDQPEYGILLNHRKILAEKEMDKYENYV